MPRLGHRCLSVDTALCNASEYGREDEVRRRLDDGADAGAVSDWGQPAIYDASAGGQEGCARLLLGAGAAVDQPDEYGKTALHGASYFGHEGCARLLLGAGAALDARPHAGPWAGKSPLDLAQEKGHAAVIALLRQAAEQRAQRQAAEEAAAARQAQEDAAAAQFSEVTGADAATARAALQQAGGDLAAAITAHLAAQATAAAAVTQPAVGTPATPAPSAAEEAEPPELDAWLASVELGRYAPQIQEYGYDTLKVLRAATEADIIEMTEDSDVKMKKPHRRLFLAEWKKLLTES